MIAPSAIASLDAHHLDELAQRLEAGTLELPVGELQLTEYPKPLRAHAVAIVGELAETGGVASIAAALRLAASARRAEADARPGPLLVWSAYDRNGGEGARATEAVVAELVREARRDILACTYSFGGLANEEHPLFGPLRGRLLDTPGLRVRLVLGRMAGARGDTRPTNEIAWAELVAATVAQLRRVWPDPPWPELFVPAPSDVEHERGALTIHAKLVVRDGQDVLLTSANLNRAAFESNVEAGVLLRDPVLSRRIVAQFDALIRERQLRAVRP